MTQPKPCTHEWSIIASRGLHGVEPPTTIKTLHCYRCDTTKEIEEPRTNATPA